MAHRHLDESLTSAAVGERLTIGGAEARHAVTVSRIGVGERLEIGNGAGLVVSGTVAVAEPAVLGVDVTTVQHVPRRAPAVFLAQALARGDRDEFAVQASTELGVDGVIPWSAARSIARLDGAKVAKRTDRWRAIVREASKQSLRAWVPDVLELVTTKQFAAGAELVSVGSGVLRTPAAGKLTI